MLRLDLAFLSHEVPPAIEVKFTHRQHLPQDTLPSTSAQAPQKPTSISAHLTTFYSIRSTHVLRHRLVIPYPDVDFVSMNTDRRYGTESWPSALLTPLCRASQGTVAARIQAFQDVPISQHYHSPIAIRPHLLGNTFEADTVVGHGRRSDSSFASPAGTTSRDGTDGIKRDGRPPVGSFDLKLQHSPVLVTNTLQSSPSQYFYQNSGLTLDGKFDADDPFINQTESSTPSKQPATELEGARARLRPVTRQRELSKGRSANNPTMAELGHMLDSAIIEQSSEASPGRSGIASPRSPLEFPRNVQAQEKTYESKPKQIERPFARYRRFVRPEASSSDYPPSSPARDAPSRTFSNSLPLLSPVPQNKSRAFSNASMAMPERHSSPVKQRAAIFESLYIGPEKASEPASPPPRAHLHHKDEWVTVPGHFPTPEVEARMHRLKFGQSVDVHHDVPEEVPPSRDTEAYDTAQEFALSPGKHTPAKSDHNRAPSRGWPSNVGVSSKTGLSYPQQTEEAMSPNPRDFHYPPTRPSIVSQRIAQLALAGLEGQQVPSRPHSTTDTRSRQTSGASGMVTKSEIREHALNGSPLRPSQMAPLQVSVQEEAHEVRTFLHESPEPGGSHAKSRSLLRGKDAPQTPLSVSMYEKQVAQTARQMLPKEQQERPSTPVRGRPQASRTPRSSGYGVEQSFYFSPDRSRSPSKASGRRLTLEINMGTPDKESMEKVVIKADMGVLNEE